MHKDRIASHDDSTILLISRLFYALSSPIRLKILFYLSDGERCACEFPHLVKASQPNTSRNLLILKQAGLVTFRKEGQKMIYSLTTPEILSWIAHLDQFAFHQRANDD